MISMMIAAVLVLITRALSMADLAAQPAPVVPPPPVAVVRAAPFREPIVPSLPAGVRVLWQACYGGYCPLGGNVIGSYLPGSRVALVRYEDRDNPATAHELCHAHQQYELERLGVVFPADDGDAINLLRDLWPQSPQGKAWGGDLETFAGACAWAWTDPSRLSQATYDLLRRIIR